MTRHLREIMVGSLLAAVFILIAHLLPDAQTHEFLSMVLVGIATAYIGFAVADGRRKTFIIEIAGVIGFCICTAIGLWLAPVALVIGYFGHGIWDVVHHPHGIQTHVTRWYIPFCLVFDWVIGAYVIYWLSTAPQLTLLLG